MGGVATRANASTRVCRNARDRCSGAAAMLPRCSRTTLPCSRDAAQCGQATPRHRHGARQCRGIAMGRTAYYAHFSPWRMSRCHCFAVFFPVWGACFKRLRLSSQNQPLRGPILGRTAHFVDWDCSGGGGRIRNHGTSRLNSFQDCRLRPLGHASARLGVSRLPQVVATFSPER